MKLIIDIPEKIVTAIQNGEDYRYDLHTTIAQGIPYEPNGDLISRKALKQMMPAPIEDEYKRVHQIIDNAPTVEAYTPEQVKELVDLNKKLSEKRPQGEWVKWSFKTFGALGDWEYKCSNCEKVYGGEYNFCPNCGADMKGGE